MSERLRKSEYIDKKDASTQFDNAIRFLQAAAMSPIPFSSPPKITEVMELWLQVHYRNVSSVWEFELVTMYKILACYDHMMLFQRMLLLCWLILLFLNMLLLCCFCCCCCCCCCCCMLRYAAAADAALPAAAACACAMLPLHLRLSACAMLRCGLLCASRLRSAAAAGAPRSPGGAPASSSGCRQLHHKRELILRAACVQRHASSHVARHPYLLCEC